jgi:predicted  nucleic acid-binding Zn-ribbon protein
MAKRMRMKLVFLVLVIPFGMLLFTGCSKKPKPTPVQVLDNQVAVTREAIDKYVEDETRADQLTDLIGEVQDVLEEYNRAFEDMVGQYREAYNDYGSSREEIQNLADQIKASTRETRSRVLDLHFKMRDLSTEKEWKKIVKHEADAIRAARSVTAQ